MSVLQTSLSVQTITSCVNLIYSEGIMFDYYS